MGIDVECSRRAVDAYAGAGLEEEEWVILGSVVGRLVYGLEEEEEGFGCPGCSEAGEAEAGRLLFGLEDEVEEEEEAIVTGSIDFSGAVRLT